MKLTTASDMAGCVGLRLEPFQNPTEVLLETQRPSKVDGDPLSVLIYGRHLSREFGVMDMHLVKQKTKAE